MNKEPSAPLTAYAIAKRTGRTQINIINFLRRSGIEPVKVEARRSLYPPEAVALARKGMRARNGTRRKRTGTPIASGS